MSLGDSIGSSLGRAIGSSLSAGGWSPLSLFAAGEQGAWYDPSDFSTMFQDSTGTTPVTAVEQPVGLILDKRLGLVRGVELVTNGDNETALFSMGTLVLSNVVASRTASPSGGGFVALAQSNSAGSVSHQINSANNFIPANTAIEVSARVYVPTGGVANMRMFDNSDGSWFGQSTALKDQWVTLTSVRPAKATAWVLGLGNNSTEIVTSGTPAFYVDNISVKELPGNHAVQATTAQKPTLSARKNLLLQTESLGTAPWSIVNTTVTPSQAANATGQMTLCKVAATTTAATILSQRVNGSGSVGGNTFRFLARKGSGATDCNTFGLYNNTTTTLLALFTVNYDTGVVSHSIGSGATMVALGGGLWEVKLTQTTGIATGNDLTIYGGFTGNAETANEFAYIGEYQLEANAASTRYQRVTTASDYDTVGFLHYLKFDGVDDGLATAAIDFTATDKTTMIAGVRKLSDAAQGCIAELTASVAANNGSWLLAAPDAATATFALDSKGTVLVDAVASGNAAPMTAVLTGLADIAGDSCALRVNGAVGDTDVGDQGTGNYSNAALYIGRRGGASLPFNGRLYQLIVRGAATASLTDLETYVNSKTGAY